MRAAGIKHLGLIRVAVPLRATRSSKKVYEAVFLVDTGSTDNMAPASKLKAIGIKPEGKSVYELADGTRWELEYGNAFLWFMGQSIAGRIVFGPEGSEPILGVTILESCGYVVSPKEHMLKRMPAIPMKRLLIPA